MEALTRTQWRGPYVNRYRTLLETVNASAPWSQIALLPQLLGLGLLLLLSGQYGAAALLLPVLRSHLATLPGISRRNRIAWPALAGVFALLVLVVLGLTLVVEKLEAQVPALQVESCRDSLRGRLDRCDVHQSP